MDRRSLDERYSKEDLTEYYARVKLRLENPTPADQVNRFKYGEMWKSMVRVPLPANEIPNPTLKKKDYDHEARKAVAVSAVAAAHCFACCKCTCLCLCVCGRLDQEDPVTLKKKD